MLSFGFFYLGSKVQEAKHQIEITSLRQELQIAESAVTQLEKNNELTKKYKEFHFLSSKILFHSLVLGKKPRDIYPEKIEWYKSSEDILKSALVQYHRIVEEFTDDKNGTSYAYTGTRLQELPPMILFRHDRSGHLLFSE